MADRGMKKYLPFRSLVEQEEYLRKVVYERKKSQKPQISTEQAEKIDRILRNYIKGEKYHFTLYIDGYLYDHVSPILELDLSKRYIYLNDFYLPINSIVDIEVNNPFEEIA